MSTSLIVTIVSAAALFGWIGVLRFERIRGQRYFAAVRSVLDRIVEWIHRTVRYVCYDVLFHTVKISGHYLVHTVLERCLQLVRFFEYKVLHLQHRNKRAAFSRNENETEGYFAEVHKHKSSTALTDREKQKLKAQALEKQ